MIATFISPYEEARRFVRKTCRHFIEIYVATPLKVCEKRDVKGLYAKASRGEIQQFTGKDGSFEPPQNPDLILNTENCSVEDAAFELLEAIRDRITPTGGEL